MGLCDSCYLPGHCCTSIRFFGAAEGGQVTFWLDEHVPRQAAASMGNDQEAGRPNPFRAQEVTERFVDEATGRPYGNVTFSCVNLQPNGRCGDYDNRPWLCRVFTPGEDYPCIHVGGAESGDYCGDETIDVVWDRAEQ